MIYLKPLLAPLIDSSLVYFKNTSKGEYIVDNSISMAQEELRRRRSPHRDSREAENQGNDAWRSCGGSGMELDV